ncbi:hypothetical protein [Granulicella pectinivorans]|nr:hypothetical protein [Granulicella pectinivorans]
MAALNRINSSSLNEDALSTFGANALYRDALLSLIRQWIGNPAPTQSS